MHSNLAWKSLADTFSMVRIAVEMVFFEGPIMALTKDTQFIKGKETKVIIVGYRD